MARHMLITLSSIPVADQAKALTFYTEVLGFEKKTDIPLGEFRWLTVVSPDAPDGVELVLEPNSNPATQTFQAALLEQGIPWTAFESSDIHAEFAQLKERGAVFRTEPTEAGGTTLAVFEDTCGNLIQMYQVGG